LASSGVRLPLAASPSAQGQLPLPTPLSQRAQRRRVRHGAHPRRRQLLRGAALRSERRPRRLEHPPRRLLHGELLPRLVRRRLPRGALLPLRLPRSARPRRSARRLRQLHSPSARMHEGLGATLTPAYTVALFPQAAAAEVLCGIAPRRHLPETPSGAGRLLLCGAANNA